VESVVAIMLVGVAAAGGSSAAGVSALYALSAPVDLAPGASAQQLREAMRGSILGRARLVGRYARASA
jgi:hypothetical protein